VSACPRCEAGDFGREPRGDGLRHKVTSARPSLQQLEEWLSESGAEASDGCWVEPDGICPHGHQSWLRLVGMI
jgi:hypothetical protein